MWGNSISFFQSWSEGAFGHPKAQLFLWNSCERGLSQKLLLFSLLVSFRVQMLAISSAIFPCLLIMSGISLPVEQLALTHCHQRCPQSPPVLLPLDPTACLSSMAHGNAHLHIIISKWGCYGVISTEESHFFFFCTVFPCKLCMAVAILWTLSPATLWHWPMWFSRELNYKLLGEKGCQSLLKQKYHVMNGSCYVRS